MNRARRLRRSVIQEILLRTLMSREIARPSRPTSVGVSVGGVATGGGTGAGGLLGPAVRGFPRRSMAASRAETAGAGGVALAWVRRQRLARSAEQGRPAWAVQAHFFGTHSLAKRCASAI